MRSSASPEPGRIEIPLCLWIELFVFVERALHLERIRTLFFIFELGSPRRQPAAPAAAGAVARPCDSTDQGPEIGEERPRDGSGHGKAEAAKPASQNLAQEVALARAAVSLGGSALRGENLVRAARRAARAGIRGLREQLRFAQMVAPFVPGVGSGAAAALAAANALAAGRPITEAAIAAARNAIPGGPLARVAFDAGLQMARGRGISQAALEAARARLPGGAAARAAFDASVAIGRGQSIQRVANRAARRALPPSPYSSDVVAFARRAGSRRWNVQDAALTRTGRLALRRM